MGRLLNHLLPLSLGRISRPDSHADLRHSPDPVQRPPQVLPDIRCQGLERRHVNKLQLLPQRSRLCPPLHLIQKDQERRQRLTCSCGRRYERMFPRRDDGPRLALYRRRFTKRLCKPRPGLLRKQT